jgi:hypothetical protein
VVEVERARKVSDVDPFVWQADKPNPKPPKGTAKMLRAEHRRDVEKKEDEYKAVARERDRAACPQTRGCRFPHCPFCARYKNLVPQAAHVFKAKGMGGDPQLVRTAADLLMLLCPFIHGRQERGEIDVEPLTSLGTAGPCIFYLVQDVYDQESGRYGSERVEWDRESAIGVPANGAPLVPFAVYRKWTEPD